MLCLSHGSWVFDLVVTCRVFIAVCKFLVVACGIQYPDQGSNLSLLHWDLGVLATGWPGKSYSQIYNHICLFLLKILKVLCIASEMKLSSLVKGCCWITTLGFLAPRGEKFNLGPETRLDHSELLCNKVLLKYKGNRESFWHRHQKGAERVHPC